MLHNSYAKRITPIETRVLVAARVFQSNRDGSGKVVDERNSVAASLS